MLSSSTPAVTFCAVNWPVESVLTVGPFLPTWTLAPEMGAPVSLSMTLPRIAPWDRAAAGIYSSVTVRVVASAVFITPL